MRTGASPLSSLMNFLRLLRNNRYTMGVLLTGNLAEDLPVTTSMTMVWIIQNEANRSSRVDGRGRPMSLDHR